MPNLNPMVTPRAGCAPPHAASCRGAKAALVFRNFRAIHWVKRVYHSLAQPALHNRARLPRGALLQGEGARFGGRGRACRWWHC
eukprot:SAG22_NODE_18987_length_279_cov_0.594444_1_plen_83_part_01